MYEALAQISKETSKKKSVKKIRKGLDEISIQINSVSKYPSVASDLTYAEGLIITNNTDIIFEILKTLYKVSTDELDDKEKVDILKKGLEHLSSLCILFDYVFMYSNITVESVIDNNIAFLYDFNENYILGHGTFDIHDFTYFITDSDREKEIIKELMNREYK